VPPRCRWAGPHCNTHCTHRPRIFANLCDRACMNSHSCPFRGPVRGKGYWKSSNFLALWDHLYLRAALDAIPGSLCILARLPDVSVHSASVSGNQASVCGPHRALWAAFIATARPAPPPPPPPCVPPAPGRPAPAPYAGGGPAPPQGPLLSREDSATFSRRWGGLCESFVISAWMPLAGPGRASLCRWITLTGAYKRTTARQTDRVSYKNHGDY